MDKHWITEQSALVEAALWMGIRDDWHEPDEQGVTVWVTGTVFDNAGSSGEIVVNLWHKPEGTQEYLVGTVNLATLFAWACGYREAS